MEYYTIVLGVLILVVLGLLLITVMEDKHATVTPPSLAITKECPSCKFTINAQSFKCGYCGALIDIWHTRRQ